METRYLSDLGKGSWNCMIETLDGGLVTYVNGQLAISRDGGLTWGEAYDKAEGLDVNWLRLKDGNILSTVYNPQTEMVKEKKMNGNTFDVAVFNSDMTEMISRQPLTDRDGCFYIQNDRIMRLKSGRILIAISRHPDETLGQGVENDCIVATYYSDDEGQTWGCSNWVGKNEQENMVVEVEDGRLLMFTRNGYGYMHYFISRDEGTSWKEYAHETPLRMPMAPFAIKKDPYSGYVFVVWDNSFPGPTAQYPRTPITLAVSRDYCKTWDVICELDNDCNSNYGYPNIAFTEDAVLVSYYEQVGERTFNPAHHRSKLRILKRNEIAYEVTEWVKL